MAEAGEGPPLVLLHGWPQHWWMWRELIPSLARRFRVIAPDLRGFGWSEAPKDGYRKDELAEDVIDLLDAMGLDRVRMMGHDWGAVVTMILALRTPDRIERAIALSVPPLWGRPKPDPRGLAGFVHVPFLASPLGPRLAPRIARLALQAGRSSGKFSDAELDTYTGVYSDPGKRHAAHRCYRSFALSEMPASLAGRWRGQEPEMPVKVVTGDKDAVTRTARDVEKVRGAGHFIVEEKPDAVLGHALSFF